LEIFFAPCIGLWYGIDAALGKRIGIKGLSETNLKQNRIFYLTYPYLHQAIFELDYFNPIRQMPSDELQSPENKLIPIRQLATDELVWMQNVALRIRQSPTDELRVPAEKLLKRLRAF